MATKRSTIKVEINRQSADQVARTIEATLDKAMAASSAKMADTLSSSMSKAVQEAIKAIQQAGRNGSRPSGGSGPVMPSGVNSYIKRVSIRNNNAASRFYDDRNGPDGKATISFNRELKEAAKNIRQLDSAVNAAQRAMQQGYKKGHITYEDSRSVKYTTESVTAKGGTYKQIGEDFNKRIEELLKRRHEAMSASNRAARGGDIDTATKYQAQAEQMDKIILKYREYNDALKTATQTLSGVSKSVARMDTDAQRGSFADKFQQRSFATGARATGAVINGVTSMYQQGFQINRSTGQQSLQMATVSGGHSDQSLRSSVQDYSARNGYTTQQGLDFYTMAKQSDRGENMTQSQTNERVKNIEEAGRASTLSENTYSGLTSVLGASGGIDNDSAMKNVVQTVLAANAMSGNAGDLEGNTNTLVSALSQIASETNVTSQGAQTAAIVQSGLSSMGSSWQGTAGQTGVTSLNSSLQSASTGGNDGMLRLIQMGSGNSGSLHGTIQARLLAEKGITNKDTVAALAKSVRGFTRSGNTDLATAVLSSTGKISTSQAQEMAESMANGTFSASDFANKQKKAKKKGSKKYSDNNGDYDKSNLAAENKNVALKEKNASKLADSLIGVTKAMNALNKTMTLQLIGNAASTVLSTVTSSVGGSLLSKGATKVANGGGKLSKFASLFAKDGTGAAGATETVAKGASNVSKVAEGASTTAKATKGVSKVAGIASKGGKFLKGASKVAGKLAVPLAIAGTAYDVVTAKTGKGKAKAAGSGLGALGGWEAGAAAGAALGSVIPGVGTVIGGAAGGIIGGIAGSGIGSWLGGVANDGWNALTDSSKKKAANKSRATASTSDLRDAAKKMAASGANKDDIIETLMQTGSTTASQAKSIASSAIKANSSSKSKLKTSQADLSAKEQKQMLDKWDDIMKQWAKNIKNTEHMNSTSSDSSKTTKSHKAFGGLVKGRTEIAEGNRAEYVVPTDPAKANYTKSVMQQITDMTGISATDGTTSGNTVNNSSFTPNITVNSTGDSSQSDANRIAQTIKQSLANAINDYRYNLVRN